MIDMWLVGKVKDLESMTHRRPEGMELLGESMLDRRLEGMEMVSESMLGSSKADMAMLRESETEMRMVGKERVLATHIHRFASAVGLGELDSEKES